MEIFFENNQIKDFEVKILASGHCEYFIPMSFIKLEGQLHVIYHTEGYKPLGLTQLNNPWEVLDLVEKFVLAVKGAQNHLILHTSYDWKLECLYLKAAGERSVNKNMEELKITFVPLKEEVKEGFSRRMVFFLKSMHFQHIRCSEYINMVIDKLESVDLSMESLINFLGELKREAYLCGWG
ncbi:DUF6382 domain-containing protein [Aminipila sp.]|uniref:DUF6382 domain-containing protein n=1 Tax=Aminipila sp. TaxID=2060095 RepID=UPI001DC3B465|nr:DUF6382 domain-containing protein [Aminipila sp.]MBE6034051.1 hypothetical protein [Clostridiales bacterium]